MDDVPDAVDALILDLLEWIGPEPPLVRDEVQEVWRTSCPRHCRVWEDANDRGFLARHHEPGRGRLIAVSPAGAAHLRRHRAAMPVKAALAASAAP